MYCPLIFWGTNYYWPMWLGNANNWLIPQNLLRDMTTNAGILLSAHFSNNTCHTDGLAMLNKWSSVLQVASRSPDLTICDFFLWGTESIHFHYLQLCMSCRNASSQLSAQSCWMYWRVWSEFWVYATVATNFVATKSKLTGIFSVSFDFTTTWNQGVFVQVDLKTWGDWWNCRS